MTNIASAALSHGRIYESKALSKLEKVSDVTSPLFYSDVRKNGDDNTSNLRSIEF